MTLEELKSHCLEQHEMWKSIWNNPDSDSLKKDIALSRMLAYEDVGKRLDRISEPLTQPEPLSPDELKVWLCTKDWIYIKDDKSEVLVNTRCWLIDLVSDKALKAVNVTGKSKIFFAEDYGKTWLAYATKPREGP